MDDADTNWEALLQAYWTGISSPEADRSIEIYSIPERVAVTSTELAGLFTTASEPQITSKTSARRRVPAMMARTQALLAVLLLAETDGIDDLEALFEELSNHPARVESHLSAEDFELLNRALYQPSIPAEGSPPTFKSLQDIASGAVGGTVAYTQLPDIGYAGIIKIGVAIIVTRVSLAVAERLSEFVHDFGRPSRPDE